MGDLVPQPTHHSAEPPDRLKRFERFAGPIMAFLSVLFIPVFLLGFSPNIPARTQDQLEILNWLIWIAFAAEFATRLLLAHDRLGLLRNSLFDVLIIALPFLRIARAARFARLFRGLGRSAIALGGSVTLGHALVKARRAAKQRGDRYVLALALIAAVAGAGMILNVERDAPQANIRNFGDACWWVVSTVTTVGYGDRFPTTTEGRLIATVLMIIGLGLFSVVTARVATFFIVDDHKHGEVLARLDRIESMLRSRPTADPSESSDHEANGTLTAEDADHARP